MIAGIFYATPLQRDSFHSPKASAPHPQYIGACSDICGGFMLNSFVSHWAMRAPRGSQDSRAVAVQFPRKRPRFQLWYCGPLDREAQVTDARTQNAQTRRWLRRLSISLLQAIALPLLGVFVEHQATRSPSEREVH